ncbi:hypothetical protein FHR84_003253 [Actinopolyspora biskrensis]|uniref:DNA recombination-mediator protein A n=1 Tax=Actinopolyspora biskrensis TaxID=1470178 RepID=A0A852YXS7_9ACTN|nr:hypothetical protein [Actinopolyspora biskrensis]NYH79904.1 hypothetical protein [Actinopolyspora biskrensis]
MIRLAITGHRGLPGTTIQLVDEALRDELRDCSVPFVGLSCLADGADSLFARAVLDHGGKLTVIVPAAHYRDELPSEHHPVYDALLRQANDVVRMDHTDSTSQAHMDASIAMIERTDRLLAVWDGQPARGYGGTADIVRAAEERNLPVTRIWPAGAKRD